MRGRRRYLVGSKMFQSAPGREAGRCVEPDVSKVIFTRFQSAPGREAGRCCRLGRWIHWLQRVSIRARP